MAATLESAFTLGLKRFQDGLTSEEMTEFRFATIEDVWKKATEIQKQQSSRGSMRNMARIEPLLSGLSRYSHVIEVFVQAKPEIMAFIWVHNLSTLCSIRFQFIHAR